VQKWNTRMGFYAKDAGALLMNGDGKVLQEFQVRPSKN
jgi:hypothetical protein